MPIIFFNKIISVSYIFLFLFFCQIIFCQESYIEIAESSTQQKIYQNFLQEQENKTQAWSTYQPFFAQKSQGMMMYSLLEDSYLLNLKKCLDNLSPQMLALGPKATYEKYAPLVSTPEELKRWYGLYSRDGFGSVIEDIMKTNSRGTYISVMEYIRQRCANLSLNRADYPILEKQVQQLLSECHQNINIEKIALLLQEYPAWLYNADELIRLGDLCLDQGDIHQALRIWYQVQSWKLNITQSQSLSLNLRIALASWLLGDHQVVQEIQTKLEKQAQEIVVYHGKEISVHNFFADLRRYPQIIPLDWNGYGGNAGNSQLCDGFDLSGQKKIISLTCTPGIISNSQMYRPCVSQNQIIVQGPYYVMSASLSSANRQWVQRLPERTGQTKFDNCYYTPVISQNNVYVISPPYKVLNNKIYCLNRQTGKKIWEWPTQTFKNDMVLQGTPLLYSGRIYIQAVILSNNIESELICLNADNGEMIYRQFLGSKKQRDYSAQKKLSYIPLPNPPVYGYGLIYVATNLGMVAAIEPITGQICWIHNYKNFYPGKYHLCIAQNEQIEEDNIEDFGAWPDDEEIFLDESEEAESDLESTILATPPVVKNGKLYVIPQDMPALLVYNVLNGQLEYSYPELQEESELQTLLGVLDDGKIVVTTPRSVLVLQTNPTLTFPEEIVAKIDIPNTLSGYGLLTRNWIYVLSQQKQHLSEINRSYITSTVYQIRISDWNLQAVSLPAMQGIPSFFIPPGKDNTVICSGNRLYLHTIERLKKK